MSEYKRRILVGGIVAVIVGIIVIAVAYLPIGGSTTSTQATTTLQGDTISNLGSYPTSNETTNSDSGFGAYCIYEHVINSARSSNRCLRQSSKLAVENQ